MSNEFCECLEETFVEPSRLYQYDAETERPFVNHAPGKCKCTNGLKRYKREDGSIRILCSCCCLVDDV